MSPLQPLDARWLDVIDEVAGRLLARRDRSGSALTAEVIEASRIYTRERQRIPLVGHAARLRFFFPRDLPKVWGPLAELASRGGLPTTRWRILDLGAGLGTTSLGASVFASGLGVEEVEVTAVERDATSLDLFRGLANRAVEKGLIPPLRLQALPAELERVAPHALPQVDLILIGLALNELHPELEGAARRDAIERLVLGWFERLGPRGSLVILEPALREVTRELMRLRDRFAAREDVTVFAPCLRDGPCPQLRRERDWCHAELDIALPEAWVSLAESAGLRSERLTYSYLVLRRDGLRLWGGGRRSWRVVGGPVASKGKKEWDLCGESGLVRVRLLQRERSSSNAAMEQARRGFRLALDCDLEDGDALRFRPDVAVTKLE